MIEQATVSKPKSELHVPFPLFLEFTASSLKEDGYPIEVAWSLPDGRIESRLINPSSVPSWTVWDVEWEDTHGVSPQSLRLFGRPPRWLAGRMNAMLAGKTLYSDNAPFARYLLDRLFETRGIRPSFTLEAAESLYRHYLSSETLRLCTQAWRSVSHRHRAALEITRHRVLWNLVLEKCGHAFVPEPDPPGKGFVVPGQSIARACCGGVVA